MSCSNCNSCCNNCCNELPIGNEACAALNSYNNEEIKPMICTVKIIDPCVHLLDFLSQMLSKYYCLFSNIINQICAIWDILLDGDGYVTVTKVYKYTVPKEKFTQLEYNAGWYWSGSPNLQESFISIPVGEMDIVDAVIAQPQVLGGRVVPVTVAIQENYLDSTGKNYIVNFDSYLLGSQSLVNDGGEHPYPYDLEVVFVVVGRREVQKYN